MMTPAQCFTRILKFQKADYIPHIENGPMGPEVEQEWHEQGLPAGRSIWQFFGFHDVDYWYSWTGGNKIEPMPGVPDQGIVEEVPGKSRTIRDCFGRVTRWFTAGMSDGAHEEIRDGIRGRADWEVIKDHFSPDDPRRYPESYTESLPPVWVPCILFPPAPYRGEKMSWQELRRMRESGERALQIAVPGVFGDTKELMGYRNFVDTMYLDPGLLEEILRTRADLACEVLRRTLSRAPFDILHFWEDAAFNTGPLIAPDMLEAFGLPIYKRIVEAYRSQGGEIVSVDSDGDISLLLPVWLKAGVNHFWPMEAKAGMDVVALRREYGQAFTMRGGVAKSILFEGKEAIDRELDRIGPVVLDGGYIPEIDHSIPAGVPFENYCYYIDEKKKRFGIR